MRGEPTSVQNQDSTRSVWKITCWFIQNTGQNQYTYRRPMTSKCKYEPNKTNCDVSQLSLFHLGGVKSSRPTVNPSAVSKGRGVASPKPMTLFHSVPERSHWSYFCNLFLEISENWTSKIFRGPRALGEKSKNRKNSNFFARNITFSGWIFIVHALSFLLRYILVV